MGLALLATTIAAWRSSALRQPAPPPPPETAAARVAAPAYWPVVTVNVNSAREAELRLLPGIGPGLAGRIVEERDAGGPFRSLEDLQRVRGIGPVTVQRLRELTWVIAEPATVNSTAEPATDDNRE